ncbi:hypothetical protein [Tellurirhabdus rosea]|uniref:hypothetical protein n=1 Tax=Tellurirhabdus rosea TaxID=2674997 RepID=UPI00225741EB|nr:hypothetical protein [Tellurirhabdus rosea]
MNQFSQRYEVLPGLPPYGPMYIPVAREAIPFKSPYSEGFVVRFFCSDGSSWVANFNLGSTNYSAVFDFPETNRTVVIAGGCGYVMDPNQTQPLATFAVRIQTAITIPGQVVITPDDTRIHVVESDGEVWTSDRVSWMTWDGIRNLRLDGHLLHGLSLALTYDQEEWVAFTLDLDTRQLSGGSYSRYFKPDGTPINEGL